MTSYDKVIRSLSSAKFSLHIFIAARYNGHPGMVGIQIFSLGYINSITVHFGYLNSYQDFQRYLIFWVKQMHV